MAKEFDLTIVAPSAYLPDPLDGVIRNIAVVYGPGGERLGSQAKGILHPEDRSTVVPPLNLSGYGYDPDDGELQEEALVWASDRDGPLGTGSPLWGVDLSPGQHHLMLTATDSIGLQGSATITVDVESVYLPLVLRAW